MGVTVQVRNLDPDVQEQLAKAAAREGMSLSAFLRRELTSMAERIAVMERARRLGITNVRNKLGGPFPELKNISTQEIVDIIHEGRESRDL